MASSNQRRNKAIMDKLIKDLSVFQEDFDETVESILNETTAVAETYAKDLTPAVTGDARAKWKTKKAYRVSNGFRSRLYNNSDHIGYINYGHRMTKHFVPGIWVGNTFEYNPFLMGEGGVMGSKTSYVKGQFMMEKAVGNAEKFMHRNAEKKIENLKRKYEK